MTQKLKKSINIIAALLASGIVIMSIGFFKGYDIAIKVSRPYGASGWTTSQEFISACTYFPMIIGLSFIILSILLSTVLFMHWLKEGN